VAPPERTDPGPARAGHWTRSRWFRALLVVVALVALWGVVLRFVLPGVLRDAIGTQLSELTERPASVERVEIEPYAMVFRLHGLKLGEQADGSDGAPARSHARLALLEADLSWRSLRHFAPVLDRLKIDEPVVFVARDAQGVYDGADVIARLAEPAPASDEPRSDAPPRFSVANIELVGGSVGLDDRKLDVRHAATGIGLRVPFVSSLPVHQTIEVEPGLEATLDGAPIRAVGQMLPFADEPAGELTVQLESFDLTRWLPHLPEPLPVKLVSAAFASELTLGFAAPESGPAKLRIEGRGALGGVEIREPDDRPLLKLPAVEATGIAFDLAASRLSIGRLAIERPEIHVERRAGEARFLERVLRALERGAQGAASGEPVDSAAAGADAGGRKSGFAWSIDEIALANGQWVVDDQQFSPRPLRLDLAEMAIEVTGLASPQQQPAQVKLSARGEGGKVLKAAAQLTIAPIAVAGEVSVADVSLARWAWLAEPMLALKVREGMLAMSTRYDVRELDGGEIDWKLSDGSLRVESVVLDEGEREVVRVGKLAVQRIAVDPSARRIVVGEALLDGGKLALRRDSSGAIDAASWWRTEPDGDQRGGGDQRGRGDQREPVGAGAAATAWQTSIEKLAVNGVEAALEYDAGSPGAGFAPLRLSGIAVEASGLATDAQTEAPVSVAAQVGDEGRISVRGTVVPTTGALALSLQARALPVPAAQPWLPSAFQARLVSGALSADGKLELSFDAGASPRGGWQGAVAVDELNMRLDREAAAAIPAGRVRAGADPADLLAWKSLKLSEMKVALEPLFVDLGDIELVGLHSRLVIQPDGRFNLQDLLARGPQDEGAQGQGGSAPPPQGQPQGQPQSAPPPLRIGRVDVADGNVDFSDYFIEPNYSANLTGLAGSIGAMRAGQPADLKLDGRIDNTGTVKIAGRIDPIGEPLSLDVRADAADIDLPALSPYSGKYVGYGIEKGKLSASVEYKVENGQLSAQNRIVLDQLTFGEPIESPDALKLPVLFAVSLLKDSRGVIDVQLPVSGSLDDPQFSVGGLVLKIIGNLIVKAVTAPFALIGGLVGASGEELSLVEFAAASAALDQGARERLATLAKALAERPGLRLDISGRSTPADREALQTAELERRLAALGAEIGGAGRKRGSLTPAERQALVEQAWMIDRNIDALPKERPAAAAMERELLDAITVPDAALNEIATRRAQAVKDWLAADGGIDASRLFLTAPKQATGAAEGDAAEGAAAGVQMTLK
jgi:hypothetical protein